MQPKLGVIRWRGDERLTRSDVSRLRRANVLSDVFPGVSALAGSEPTFEERAIAASWSCGGFISHSTAARLRELRSWTTNPELHVSVTRDRVRDLESVTVHRRRGLSDSDVVAYAEGVLIASVPLTLLDIAFTARPFALRSAYHDAWHRGLVTPGEVHEVIDRLSCSGRSGGPKLRATLDRYPSDGSPARSKHELRLYDVIYDHPSMPVPLLNFRVVRQSGVPAFIDLAWPELRYGIEIDDPHTHADRWAEDVTRMEELNDLGWTIDRVMSERVEHQLSSVVERIGQRLRRHGAST